MSATRRKLRLTKTGWQKNGKMLTGLNFCYDIQIPSYLVLMVQAGGGDVILYGIFFGHTLNSLIPNIQDFKSHRQSERCC